MDSILEKLNHKKNFYPFKIKVCLLFTIKLSKNKLKLQLRLKKEKKESLSAIFCN